VSVCVRVSVGASPTHHAPPQLPSGSWIVACLCLCVCVVAVGRIGGYRDLIIVNTVSPILYVMMLSHHEHAIWTHTPLANANALTGGGGSTASSSSDGGLPSDALPAAVIPRGTSVGYVVLVVRAPRP
jgi:hypothetical protein